MHRDLHRFIPEFSYVGISDLKMFVTDVYYSESHEQLSLDTIHLRNQYLYMLYIDCPTSGVFYLLVGKK